ncbi:hypothetical protein EKO04_006873 [Ascochyta lentis]|uniref:Aldehyde dehydrogenase domain-containing protein n=1 Tax=Ascochyta lentis TaxID=205686 RepID=A0A8H7J469_9PLEO|nr:hypothetical protein EKO04_006873 [Ascochyta lentis]
MDINKIPSTGSAFAGKKDQELAAKRHVTHAMGQPTDLSTFLGPLVDGEQFERVMSFLDIGKEEAELLTRGTRQGENGQYIQPNLLEPQG